MPDAEITGREPYTAQQGDSFDMLALQAYGDERLASLIADANPGHIDVLLFEGGEELLVPTIAREPDEPALAPWLE